MKKDNLICFFVADLVSMFFFLFVSSEWMVFTLKLVSALAMGIVGGIAGMAGKDFYSWARVKVKIVLKNILIKKSKNKSDAND